MIMKFFKEEDFRCKHCDELPKNGMNQVLLAKLDALRELIGVPIYISCGYRCQEHNDSIPGSVPNSQHVMGTAADIYTDNLTVDELADFASQIGFDGLGRYYDQDFVHVDCRDDGDSPNTYLWTDQD